MRGLRAGKSGFTLAELMLVVAIICMLAVIVLPAYARAKGEAQLTTCVENLRSMGVAYQGFLNENPQVVRPATLNQLVPKYISRIPTCPSSGASRFMGGVGYLLWWTGSGASAYAFVTCTAAHNEIITSPLRTQYQGPTWSPKTGVNDGRKGDWVF